KSTDVEISACHDGGVDTLVLWDIDLTLVDYSGIGRRWYTEALAAAVGKELAHMPVFAGRTERSLARELLREHGEQHDEADVDRLLAALETVGEAARPTMREMGRALDGAAEILAALSGHDGVVQSLVTGNLPKLADVKLAPFELDRHVDLTIGGYGSLSEHR